MRKQKIDHVTLAPDVLFLLCNGWFQFLYSLMNFDIFLVTLNFSGYFDNLTIFVATVALFGYFLSVTMIFAFIKIFQVAMIRRWGYNVTILTTKYSNQIISIILCFLTTFAWICVIGEFWMFRNYQVHLFGNLWGVLRHPFIFFVMFNISTEQILLFLIFFTTFIVFEYFFS